MRDAGDWFEYLLRGKDEEDRLNFFKVSFMSWLQTSPFRPSWCIGKWPKSCPKNAIIPTIYFHDFQVSFMICHGS